MRVLISFLTNTFILILIQQLVSTWFLFDFFLARDSITASSIWQTNSSDNQRGVSDRLSILSQQIKSRHCSNATQKEASFDKVIFVVIDALGVEFIPTLRASLNNDTQKDYNIKMPFIEKSLKQGKAMGFMAKASTPTVTMPRVKALLSGTVPSFIDIMHNLARDVSKFQEDNILRIANLHNKSIVFYGDDTWLQLFEKSIFVRSRETLSFFASDYTTVDTNVTELALPETSKNNIDWDLLILHYLGLDHIGHVYGTNESPLIDGKLLEMDQVLNTIHDNMAKKSHRTLIVVCGDHGMSDVGNHGGDTKLESETAMIFLPINHQWNPNRPFSHSIKQVDLAITLAFLTKLPIPILSRGVAIEPLLDGLWSDKNALSCAALDNFLQLIRLSDKNNLSNEEEKLIKLLIEHLELKNNLTTITQNYFLLARQIQDQLLQIIASNSNPGLIATSLAIVILLTFINARKISLRLSSASIPKTERYMCIVAIIIPILMHGSTDFIESEHLFWFSYSLFTMISFSTIAIIPKPDIIRSLDPLRVALFFITYLITSLCNNIRFMQSGTINPIFTFISITFLCNSMIQSCDIKKLKKLLLIPLAYSIMFYKIYEHSQEHDTLIIVQRILLLALSLYTLVNLVSKSGGNDEPGPRFTRKLSTSWMALAFLLARRHNLIFLIANTILEPSVNSILDTLKLSRLTKVVMYMHLAQSSFYNQGNSNLFTTLDVNSAFYGQSEYSLMLAVPLVALSTYSSQIYWYLKLFQRIQLADKPKTIIGNNSSKVSINTFTENDFSLINATSRFVTMCNFLSLAYYMYVCLILRNHLFIWTVISPKLIYHYTNNFIVIITCSLIPLTLRYKLLIEGLSSSMKEKESII